MSASIDSRFTLNYDSFVNQQVKLLVFGKGEHLDKVRWSRGQVNCLTKEDESVFTLLAGTEFLNDKEMA